MIVYLVCNKINGKFYVGKTVKSLERRWAIHRSVAKHGGGYHLHKAIRKYGEDNFDAVVLDHADNEQDLALLEQMYVAAYRADDPRFGYNLTKGGEGCTPNDATRDKISKANRGRVHTERSCRNMSKGHTHKKLGPLSDETRRKLSAGRMGNQWAKGAVRSPETRQKMREAQRKRYASPEARRKMSEAAKRREAAKREMTTNE